MSNNWVVGVCVLVVSVGVWWWRSGMGSGGIPKGNLGWPWIGETLDFISSGYSSNPVSFMQKRQSMYVSMPICTALLRGSIASIHNRCSCMLLYIPVLYVYMCMYYHPKISSKFYGLPLSLGEGMTVFKSHVLGRQMIVSTDAEVNKMVLQNDGKIFVPFYPRSVSLLLGETSILKINGNVQRKVHGLIGSFLKSPGLKTRIAKERREYLGMAMEQWEEGRTIYLQDETINCCMAKFSPTLEL